MKRTKRLIIGVLIVALFMCFAIGGCANGQSEDDNGEQYDYSGKIFYKVLENGELSNECYVEIKSKDKLRLHSFEFGQSFLQWIDGEDIDLQEVTAEDLEYFIDAETKSYLFVHIFDKYAINFHIQDNGDLTYAERIYRQK